MIQLTEIAFSEVEANGIFFIPRIGTDAWVKINEDSARIFNDSEETWYRFFPKETVTVVA